MNKKNIVWIIIIVLLVAGLIFLAGKSKVEAPIVGGDKDIHGCIGSAGYSWCEFKQKCLRVWEEPCKENTINFTKEGNITGELNDWTLVYEEPGKPALTQKIRFDNLSECLIACEKQICDSSKLINGERVKVSGNLKDGILLVTNMVYANKLSCNID